MLQNFPRKKFIAPLLIAAFIAPFATIPTFAQSNPPTARQVVKMIQDNIGIPWQKETVDTFKAGNPDTPVTGIAVTMMATMDVLERAAANHENFVITHEPTFYNHLDVPEGMPESDPVWAEKRAFIEKHNMVVWRFHDHWQPPIYECRKVRSRWLWDAWYVIHLVLVQASAMSDARLGFSKRVRLLQRLSRFIRPGSRSSMPSRHS